MLNLRELTSINSSLVRTAQAQKPVLIKSAGTGLRKAVLERLINPEVIDALSPRESGYTVETLFDLGGVEDAAATFYDRYEDYFQKPQLGDMAVKAAFNTWRNAATICGLNLTNLLLVSVHNNDGAFRSEKLKAIAAATKDVRDFFRSIGRGGEEPSSSYFLTLRASSDVKRASKKSLEGVRKVICWEHDWPGCPYEVVALAPIAFPEA